jgi:hypothetical protein
MKMYFTNPVSLEGTPQELNEYVVILSAQANINEQFAKLQEKLNGENDDRPNEDRGKQK